MELGAAVNCNEGEKGGVLPLLPIAALPGGSSRLTCYCCSPGASKLLVLVILWSGDLSGQDTQKEQTASRNEAIAWWRQEKTRVRQLSSQQQHPGRLRSSLPLQAQAPLAESRGDGNPIPAGWRWFAICSPRHRAAAPGARGPSRSASPFGREVAADGHRQHRPGPPASPGDRAGTAGGAPREHPSCRDAPCPHPARWLRAPKRFRTRHTLEVLCHELNCFKNSLHRENRWQQLGSSDYY